MQPLPLLRAKLMYSAGQYRACLRYLDSGEDDSNQAVNLRAACNIRLKNYSLSLRLLQSLEPLPEVVYNKALCLYAMTRCEESLDMLETCTLQDSDTSKLRVCLFIKLGKDPQSDLSLTHFSSLNTTMQVRSKPVTRLPSAMSRPTTSTLLKSTSESYIRHRKHLSAIFLHQPADDERSPDLAQIERENIRNARKVSQSFLQQVDDRKQSKDKKLHWVKKFVISTMVKGKSKLKSPPSPPGLKMKDIDTHRNSFVVDKSVFQEIKQTDQFVTSQQALALFPSSNPYRSFTADGFTRLSFYTTLKVIEEFKKPDRDLDKLYSYLKDTKFMSRFYPDMGKNILALGELEEMQQGQVVFCQGDPGLHLYMIIRGSVEVVKHSKEFGKFPLVVASIYDGEVFGDYSIVKAGLMQMGPHTRSADCRAAEHCWLMKVEMEGYLQIINSYQMAHLEGQLRFLCKLPMFAGAQNMELCIMADHLETKDYRLYDNILEKGQTATKLHIIMLGRVQATGKMRQLTWESNYKTGFQPRIRDVEESCPMVAGQYFGEMSIVGNPVASCTKFTAWSGNVRVVLMSKEHTPMIPEPLRSNFLEYLRKSSHYELRLPSFDNVDEAASSLAH